MRHWRVSVYSLSKDARIPKNQQISRDAFCLFYDAKAKQVKGLNGSGRSPQALTIAAARKAGIVDNTIPLTDLNSVTVPGAAAAWVDVIQNFGSSSVTLHDVLDPTIRMAEEGYVLCPLRGRTRMNSTSQKCPGV